MVLIIGGMSQGKTEFAKTFKDYKILDDLHEIIREKMKSEMSKDEIRNDIFKMINEKTVIVSNEIGCGIIPIDAFEREYRDFCGEILIDIARKSDKVYRVVAGIPEEVK